MLSTRFMSFLIRSKMLSRAHKIYLERACPSFYYLKHKRFIIGNSLTYYCTFSFGKIRFFFLRLDNIFLLLRPTTHIRVHKALFIIHICIEVLRIAKLIRTLNHHQTNTNTVVSSCLIVFYWVALGRSDELRK